MQSDVRHEKRPFLGALFLAVLLEGDRLRRIVIFMVVENVQVQGSGTEALSAFYPAKHLLNLLEAREEGQGREKRLNPTDSIEKVGLLRHILGFGLKEARGGLDVAQGGLCLEVGRFLRFLRKGRKGQGSNQHRTNPYLIECLHGSL